MRGGWLGVIAFGLTAAARAAEPSAGEFFERQVRPILAERCQGCHGPKKAKGGLRLTGRDAILRGGATGPAAVPGKPDESLLVKAVRRAGELEMPPKDPLSAREIDVLTRWVRDGLPWPAASGPASDDPRNFWAFQPVRDPPVPVLGTRYSVLNPIDAFIAQKLAEKGLTPAPPADRRTLLRRVTYDLTGLPPTPAEVDAFVTDPAPDAYARLVDRLLASPAYGEKWGRHWLDLARYTDSFDSRIVGNELDCAAAWRYRDWVINAFNRDLPYDRFVQQQVAGDLLPESPGGPLAPDGVVATGMLAIGNWGGGDADKEKLLTDIADDQVDVVSKTFLGLTAGCARCHDHKFDPITQADYYGLAGIFFSTHILPDVGPKTNGPNMLRIPLETAADRELRRRRTERVAELGRRIERVRADAARAVAERERPRAAEYALAAWDYTHGERGALAPRLLPDKTHRGADAPRSPVAAFAAGRGLDGPTLTRWLTRLGLSDDRPLDRPVSTSRPGVVGRRGPANEPNVLVNTTDRPVTISTLTLPPRSVAVHPGPAGGVVLAWHSPVTGTVRFRGRVADADAVCGDGVAWALDHRTPAGRDELAAGGFGNGGSQDLPERAVTVREGESLELVVLPKANHACDTTVVELTITADGGREWNVTRDLVADPNAINAGPWHVADATGRPRTVPEAVRPWRRASVAATDRTGLERAARELVAAGVTADDGPIDEGSLPADARAELARLRAERSELQKLLAPPPFANGAQEGGVPGSPHAGVHDVRIHLRGRYDRLGEMVPRRFPTVLAGEHQPPITQGSGRRELAAWLTNPHNPLTARVLVNRLWQHHFGEGLVRTPSNFGALGERPTHPELLDWLASEFMASGGREAPGWSLKRLHRLILLSATYQQSSTPSPDALHRDPDNRLWARQNRRRLTAEELRDALLAVAGRLDRAGGGPADRDFARPRRTVYQMTVRSDRSGFGPLFDAADPTAPVDRRTDSTVAPQALFLMNHPFVAEQARALAAQAQAGSGDDRARIGRLYATLFGRPPTDAEMRVGLALLAADRGGPQACDDLCRTLLCANEFAFVD